MIKTDLIQRKWDETRPRLKQKMQTIDDLLKKVATVTSLD